MLQEVQNMLRNGIIEEPRSPWCSQAFVVRRQKPRTIHRFTSLGADPFRRVEKIIDTAAENSFFSKINLKSGCHQIRLREKTES